MRKRKRAEEEDDAGSQFSKGGSKITKKRKYRPGDEHADGKDTMGFVKGKRDKGDIDYDKYEGMGDEEFGNMGKFRLGMYDDNENDLILPDEEAEAEE